MTSQRIMRSYLAIAGLYTLSASLIWGVNTLFLLDAGLAIFQVFIANAVFTASMALFEIPTGVLADSSGRRLSFLLSVAVISVLVFSLLGRPPVLVRLASRVILLPVIAGIAYEYIRFTARHMNKAIIRIIAQPNLALQRLTTGQPTYDMIECAITALECVLAAENSAEKAREGSQVTETVTV